MQFFLLIIFLSFDYSKLSGFSFDHTDRLLNGLDRDCLYYNAHDKGDVVFQIIEYCIRVPLREPVAYNTSYHSLFTFKDLRQANITSRQMYTWSAPEDLIEHYQNYLENENPLFDKFLFYNCTYPWFGSRCEYRFDQPESNFAQQIEAIFETQEFFFRTTIHKISCYIHLQCDRGKTPDACLDWREVCNGKVDCLGGGYDEEHCWQLEVNECDNETEFRCHIGLCISVAFLNDDRYNADCLDQSDEGFTGLFLVQVPVKEDIKALVKPMFRFEEHMCYVEEESRNEYGIECGHLTCEPIERYKCFNGKTTVLRHAYYIGANISAECLVALSCLIDSQFAVNNSMHICNRSLLSTFPEKVKQY
jgi:hypothetical protein